MMSRGFVPVSASAACLTLVFALPAQDLVGPAVRQATARQRLAVQWDNYIKKSDGQLPVAAALKDVKRNDPRPVFFWRDCDACTPKEHAQLEKTGEDERILLAASWFRCVRVDMGVGKPTHPLHALFAGSTAGPVPHLVFVSADGSERQAWSGKASAKGILALMTRVLAKDYYKPADPAVSRWLEILSKFDGIDERRVELGKKREKLQDPKRVSALDLELRSLDEQHLKLEQEEKTLRELGGLRKPPVEEEAADHDAEGAEAVRGTGGRKPTLLDRTRQESQPAGGDKSGEGAQKE